MTACICKNGRRYWCKYPHRGTQRARRSHRTHGRHVTAADFCCGGEYSDWIDQRIKWRALRDDLRNDGGVE